MGIWCYLGAKFRDYVSSKSKTYRRVDDRQRSKLLQQIWRLVCSAVQAAEPDVEPVEKVAQEVFSM